MEHLTTIEKPKIRKSKSGPYTKVEFLPDYERFGIKNLTDVDTYFLGNLKLTFFKEVVSNLKFIYK